MGWLTRAEAAALTEEQRLDYITRTILGEAVGEGYTGMLVVAQVIQNRSEDGRWPSDPVAVAGQKNQFTTNSPGYGGNQGMVSANYGPDTKEYRMAQAAARAAIFDHSVPDITGGAVHYHTIAMGWPASWPSSIKQHGFIDIGAHRVYPEHPVPPGEIPTKLASLQYIDGQVGTLLSIYDERGIKPIRPATMSSAVRLQRELNRVAAQKANAAETVKRSRVLAFGSTIDPFEMPRPSNANLVINRPIPAMKESMQRQLRATGTVNTSDRTFAQLVSAGGMDAPGLTLVSRPVVKPPVVQAAPWGVREEVAAGVAASDAAAGRGQLVMTGNPNVPGSVVDWLYPKIEEGTGEANQEGKGPRARVDVVGTSIDRGRAAADPGMAAVAEMAAADARERPRPGQSIIERSAPIVLRQPNGTVRVIPQSQIERNDPDVVRESMKRANEAADPDLAISLAASIASRPARSAGQNIQEARSEQASARAVSPIGRPPTTRVVKSVPVRPAASADRNIQSARDEQAAARGPGRPTATPAVTASTKKTAADLALIRAANQGGATVSQPAGSTAVKDEARLPTGFSIQFTPSKPVLPALPPPKADPIGMMPKFGELAAINRPALSGATAPVPASVKDREVARGSTLFGTPQQPNVAPTMKEPEMAVVPMPKPRPTTRPIVQAPMPAVRRPTVAAAPRLSIVVDGATPIRPAAPPARAVSAVERFKEQGMSAAEAYDAANQAAKDRAIANAAPGYNDPNALWRKMLE